MSASCWRNVMIHPRKYQSKYDVSFRFKPSPFQFRVRWYPYSNICRVAKRTGRANVWTIHIQRMCYMKQTLT